MVGYILRSASCSNDDANGDMITGLSVVGLQP